MLLAFGFLSFFAARWSILAFGNVGFDSILFTLMSGLDGMDSTAAKVFLSQVILPVMLLTAASALIFCHNLRCQLCLQLLRSGKEIWISPLRPGAFLVLSAVVCVLLTGIGARRVKLNTWLRNLHNTSDLLEVYYVNPADVEISFPEQKRNLVYIIVESMESTFLSKEEGGAMKRSRMPEMAALAQEYVNFSQTDRIGGWGVYDGTTWTTAGILSQMSGVPMTMPYVQNKKGITEKILPRLTTLWDFLHENGYQQRFMMGSDSRFSDMGPLMQQHGMDSIVDKLMTDGRAVAEKDKNAWGFSDRLLYEFARQDITELARSGQPFAVYINTIDTHSPTGYPCRLCGDEFDEQYENVYACVSRQTADFVQWLQEQPCYKDTAVIICGDHLSMARAYISRNGLKDADRRVYNCFINAAAEPVRMKNREIGPFDMFPTALTAMGCRIEGDRLGLGTNLFSDRDTLAEEMGLSQLQYEIEHLVLPYMRKFMLE